MKNQLISMVMSRTPATVPPGSSVAEAHRRMQELGCHHLPVVEHGALVGMLSASDIVKALVPAPGSPPSRSGAALLQERRVSGIMSRRVVSLPQDATLEEAARKLATGDFHSLPVVGPGGALVGILTARDLAELLVASLAGPDPDPESAPPVPAEGAAARQARVQAELYQAVKLYLCSGRGDLEHGRLQRAFDAARECLESSQLGIQV
ncbi:MAG: CBS domain-containing protein [Gammaproteobacteria bacterium]|nr:MAG: CBS domain-containing protein [Gammaproteobacteria bacterium]